MKITKEEKNRILKLHESYRNCNGSLIKEHALGGMASVGSGFVNPQGGTGRVGQFLQRQKELDECGESGGPMEDNVMQSYDQRYDPPMEENLAGFYEVPMEREMTLEEELGIEYQDDEWVVLRDDDNDEATTEIEIKEESTGREIHTHDEMIKYGEGSRWCPAAKDLGHIFNSYYEHYGPFIIYKNEDESVKIACINNECYDDQDNRLSLEEAAELLGVETLEDIAVQC